MADPAKDSSRALKLIDIMLEDACERPRMYARGPHGLEDKIVTLEYLREWLLSDSDEYPSIADLGYFRFLRYEFEDLGAFSLSTRLSMDTDMTPEQITQAVADAWRKFRQSPFRVPRNPVVNAGPITACGGNTRKRACVAAALNCTPQRIGRFRFAKRPPPICVRHAEKPISNPQSEIINLRRGHSLPRGGRGCVASGPGVGDNGRFAETVFASFGSMQKGSTS